MASTVTLRTIFLETRDSSSAADLAHDNLGPNLNIAIWILTGAAIIFLCLRLYCKLGIRRGLWWDDYVLIAASVSAPPSLLGRHGLTNLLRWLS